MLLEWVRDLTPMDVSWFDFPFAYFMGLFRMSFREAGGELVSAYSASDGTLRFLAMFAALLGKAKSGLFFFVALDIGIYSSRLNSTRFDRGTDCEERCSGCNHNRFSVFTLDDWGYHI